MPLTYRLIITSALVLCVGISDALLLLTTANHRTPIFPKAPPPTVVLLQLARHNNVYEPELLSVQQIVKTIGVLSLGASILVMNAGDASAASAASSMPFFWSPSTQLAMEVKTMDMSLPSSYDAISGAKSTGGSLMKEIERTGTMPTNKVQREKSNEGSSLASNLLPSLKKAPKEKGRVQAVKVEEDKKFENIQIVDMDMPSYSATPPKEKSAFSL